MTEAPAAFFCPVNNVPVVERMRASVPLSSCETIRTPDTLETWNQHASVRAPLAVTACRVVAAALVLVLAFSTPFQR